MLKDLLINHLAPGEVDRTGERVDGKATIIGKLGYYWIAVLDAEHRRILSMGNTREVIFRSAYEEVTTNWNISPLWTPARLLTQIYDPVSSEVNTSVATESYPALFYCKNLRLLERPCALPNAQTLAFIWQKRSFIDENDPTISQNKSLITFWSDNIFCYTSSIVRNSVSALHSYGHNFTNIPYTSKYGIIPILEIPAYEDRTGERIDGKATIIGRLSENWIAVFDAAYRGTAQYCVSSNMEITKGLPYTSGDYTVTATSTENYILAQTLYDIHSSKWNTCYLNQVQTATRFPAAKMCYDINVGGNHAQLPNAQALAFVYSKKDYIDAKDPTASTNPDKKLSNWGFGSSSGYLAASTNGAGSAYCVAMNASGLLHSAFTSYRTGVYGVCPILEIPLYKDRTGERVDDKATIAGKLGNYWIAVLDATYQDSGQWGTYGQVLNGLVGTTGVVQAWVGWTEAAILSQASKDPNTSKQNTDWLRANESTYPSPAAKKCYSIIINGTNAQLPNIQTAIFAAVSLPDVVQKYSWTSTKFKDNNMEVYYVSIGSPSVQAGSILKTSIEFTSPVLEIPLWCDDDYK